LFLPLSNLPFRSNHLRLFLIKPNCGIDFALQRSESGFSSNAGYALWTRPDLTNATLFKEENNEDTKNICPACYSASDVLDASSVRSGNDRRNRNV
jgi:hypothetical protein